MPPLSPTIPLPPSIEMAPVGFDERDGRRSERVAGDGAEQFGQSRRAPPSEPGPRRTSAADGAGRGLERRARLIEVADVVDEAAIASACGRVRPVLGRGAIGVRAALR